MRAFIVAVALLLPPPVLSEPLPWCPFEGYWAGHAKSIDAYEGTVGRSVHGGLVNADCTYGFDVFGVDRETGQCVRKGQPYYGRIIPFGPLWQTAPLFGPPTGVNAIVVSQDLAQISFVVQEDFPTLGFVEETALVWLGYEPPASLQDAIRQLKSMECDP